MLPALSRLREKRDFELVLKKGKTVNGNGLSLKFIKGSEARSRFGLLVAKRTFRKAALRNKIKRRLRAQLSSKLSLLESGNDVIVIARAGIEKKESRAISQELQTLLLRAKLLKQAK